MDNNEKRAKALFERYGFDFKSEFRDDIKRLLNDEIENFQTGSSEYLRVLCGFLFCIGDIDDLEIIKNVKYKINFDVGSMIDSDWIEYIDGTNSDHSSIRKELVKQYSDYYKHYFDL